MQRLSRVFHLLACIALAISLHAAKPNVYVAEFTNECNTNNSYVSLLRNIVIGRLHGTNRVNIYTPDADMLQALEEQRREGRTLGEDDVEMMRELERRGANSIVAGSLDAVSVSKKTNDKGETTYSAVISVTLRAVNPQDGKVLKSVSHKYGESVLGLFGATGKTADEAVQKAMEEVSAWGLVEAIAPLKGSILELEKVNKNKLESLYIDLGSDDGVGRGHDFAIMLNRKIGGMDSQTRIGTIEVVEVQGPKVSLCKVKKGKQEILDAYNKDQVLTVNSF